MPRNQTNIQTADLAKAAEVTTESIPDYIAALKASETLSPQITSHTILPAAQPVYGQIVRPWPRAIGDVLGHMSIASLYSHQARAIDGLRAGEDIIVATPTASGKSLIYTLPVLESFLQDPEARSLFLFPLKALAQDQLGAFTAMTAHWPEGARPAAAVYDGDTPAHVRRKIRENPPQVILSNPEMIHLSMLPHHNLWSSLFAGLSLVVVDEVHTYRGVMGSHMAQVFRRLLRVAGHYGSRPSFAFCSATVGNPEELARQLTGREPTPVLQSGAPQGQRHYIFMNPLDSPASLAIRLLKSALKRNLRTIVYCQSRRMTELISLWAQEQSGPYTQRISAYRAGFLPEERREIEARMASGELLAVVSTSALELGIDIGNLDLCILVGYPGTVMATLQRGGRVGRSSQESAVVLIAQEDALDQYIVRHSQDFFRRPPEKAVLNPENPVIVERHLECAAAELPLRPETSPDRDWLTPANAAVLKKLEARGILLRSADGHEIMAARKRPQRHVSLRGSGHTITIETTDGQLIGSLDGIRALREAHPGAIYLHLGRHFEIFELDLPGGRALARPFKPSWYTRPRGHKNTQILSLDEARRVAGIPLQRGRLRITDHITGYEKRANRTGQLLGVVPLDLPPQIFETEGLWFQIPDPARKKIEQARMHFMGSIHALEHAAIGILPLLVMSDRNDFGGISTPMHPQTGRPTIYIYDGMPGGAGLSRAAFSQADIFFERVREVMADCPCEFGCPSCVHSPKCGSGNRPMDKAGALSLLEDMLVDTPQTRAEAEDILSRPLSDLETAIDLPVAPLPQIPARVELYEKSDPCLDEVRPEEPAGRPVGDKAEKAGPRLLVPDSPDYVVLDVETRRSAAEVGGWHRCGRMGVSVAVLYDSASDRFMSFRQEDIPSLADCLSKAPLVIGFNLLRFDYPVLEPHAPGMNFRTLNTLDLLLKIQDRLSYRVSLDNLARATLGAPKSADGLMALKWWQEQRLSEIEEYCRQDVALTRDLYLFGKNNKYLLFTNKSGQSVRVPVDW